MVDLAELSHVSWDDVVALARRIVTEGVGDGDAALKLAEMVVRFHEQTVGAAASVEVARATRRA